MASKTIEREVVELALNPKDFRKGVDESLKLIDQLMASLKLDNAAKGFAEVEKASKGVKFQTMGKSIDSVNAKMTAMSIVAATVINRMTNAVIDSAKQLFNAAFLQPLKDGMSEYETQMGAIQTILANTSHKGTGLEDVQGALDELNQYADLTIYNFTQMTENIGKFTAAGVDLDVSVTAIKGIANLAAVSGSNSQQASTAMYQLSQAIAAGSVKLQDWNSVVNAGMGGELFQKELIRTAKVHGVNIDAIIAKNGSFRMSLQEGWLDSSIMLDTLAKFTGELSDEQLLQLGYTREQVEEIQALGEMATDAATKIKTLTQLKDTMAEALGSGWAQTWRIIFGDFDEAKELFGQLGSRFGSIIDNSSKARNSLLEMWKGMGGRIIIIESLNNVLDGLTNFLTAFGKGFKDVIPSTTAGDLFKLTVAFKNLSEKLLLSEESLRKVRWIARGLASILSIVKMAVFAVIDPIVDKFAPGLKEGGQSVLDFIVNLSKSIYTFRNFAERTGYFNTKVAEIIAWLKMAGESVRQFVTDLQNFEFIKDVTTWFQTLTKEDVYAFLGGIGLVIQSITKSGKDLVDSLADMWASFNELKVVQDIQEILSRFTWSNFKSFLDTVKGKLPDVAQKFLDFKLTVRDIVDSVSEFVDAFTGSDGMQNLFESIQNFSLFPDNAVGQVEDMSAGMGGLTEILSQYQEEINWLKGAWEQVKPILGQMAEWSKDALSSLGDWIGEGIMNMDVGAMIGALAAFLAFSLTKAIKQALKGDWLTDILNLFVGSKSTIVSSITDTLGAVENTFVSLQSNIKADTLTKIAIAIGVVTISIIALSFLDAPALAKSLGVLGVALLGLFGASGTLSKMDMAGSTRSALSMTGVAVAILVLAKAMSEISGLNIEQIKNGLAALAVGLTELVVAVRIIDSGSEAEMLKKAVLIQGISASMVVLSEAVQRFGDIPYAELKQGLAAVAIALTELVIAFKIMAMGNNEKDMLSSSVSIVIISGAMFILAEAVKAFGAIPYEAIEQGLLAIGVLLAQFALFSQLTSGGDMTATAISLAIMAAAVMLLSHAVGSIGALSWDTLLRGLAGLAGTLAILALAATLMNGALPGAAAMLIVSGAVLILSMALTAIGNLGWDKLLIALVGLAGFFVVLGLAAVILAPLIPGLVALAIVIGLIGIGAMAFGIGLFLAAAGLTAMAASATLIAAAIGIIGAAVITILPELARAIGEAIVGFITAISDSSQDIFDATFALIITMLQSITEATPQIIEAILGLITAIMTTIAEQAPLFIQTGFDILLAFLKGMEDNIQEVVDTALGIVEEFIRGLEEGIPGLIDAAFSFILTFVTAMADAVDEYLPEIVDSFYELGEALVGGLVQALYDGFGKIATAAADMAGAAWESFKEAAGISSPSKVFYRLARWIPQAIVNAFGDGDGSIRQASGRMIKSAQNGINLLIESMERGLNDDRMFSPTITPVLDMGAVQSSLRSNRGIFDGLGELNAVGARVQRTSQNKDAALDPSGGTSGSGDGNVTFVQHNHSPKALNTLEIYRKTDSQMSRLKNRNKVT